MIDYIGSAVFPNLGYKGPELSRYVSHAEFYMRLREGTDALPEIGMCYRTYYCEPVPYMGRSMSGGCTLRRDFNWMNYPNRPLNHIFVSFAAEALLKYSSRWESLEAMDIIEVTPEWLLFWLPRTYNYDIPLPIRLVAYDFSRLREALVVGGYGSITTQLYRFWSTQLLEIHDAEL